MDSKTLKQAITKGFELGTAVGLPGLGISLADFQSATSVDERISRLDKIKADLEAATAAVTELQADAITSKGQVERLRKEIAALEEDRATVAHQLKVPEESFARVYDRVTRKSRRNGLIVGIIVGLVTGYVSGYLVWLTTEAKDMKPAAPAQSVAPTPRH
jgi:hypothetical protein